jgi:methylase of polypeptide subunit release factors
MKPSSYLDKICGTQIEVALRLDPRLVQFFKDGKLDLGNSTALLLYNKVVLKEFMDLTFDLPDGYLIPTICSRWKFLKYVLQYNPTKVLEIGTGASGILSLMLGRLGISVTATEVDKKALRSAQSNIELNNLTEKVSLVQSQGEIVKNLIPQLYEYDLIICNPPQYDEKYYQEHKSNSRGFIGKYLELVGGDKGYEFILTLLAEVKEYSNPPPVFFQITLPRLKTVLEDELEKQQYEYSVVSTRIGTRERLYYRIEFF